MNKRYNNITEVEKGLDTIEEVQKFNPHHDSKGRFTTGGGGGMGSPNVTGGKITSPSQLKTGETYELRDQLTGQTVVGTGKYEGRVGSEHGPELHQFDMGTNKAIYTKDQIENGTVSHKVGKSLDHIEEVEKANPYHDNLGRFTTASGGGGGRSISPAAQKLVDNASEKTKNEIRNILNGGSAGASVRNNNGRAKQIATATGYREISGTLSSKKVKEAQERGGHMGEVNGKNYLISPQKDKTLTVYTGTKAKSGGLNLEKYITGIKDAGDAADWGRGTILNE